MEEAIEGLAEKLVLIDSINAPEEPKETARELIKRYRDILDSARRNEASPSVAIVAEHTSSLSPFQTTLKPKPQG